VRVLVANCSVEYQGRRGARLPAAARLIMLKADGSIAIHADAKAYKPLNWMSPPCTVREGEGRLLATTPAGETITVELHEVLHDYRVELGDDPGLAPTVGMFVATRIKPQAKVFAQSRGIHCVEIDLEELRAGAPLDLRLF
jgi:RecB family endonuclease NucS